MLGFEVPSELWRELVSKAPLFLVFAVVAVFFTVKEWRRLRKAQGRLQELKRLVDQRDESEDSKPSLLTAKRARQLCNTLRREAKSHPDDPLSPWIEAADFASQSGPVEASALTDAVWSKEKERNAVSRFIAKNMILLGLLLTSLGLAIAVLDLNLGDSAHALENLNTSLSAMAMAFVSSLLGLSFNLVLSAMLVWVESVRDNYLKEVDTLLQGIVIPAFDARYNSERDSKIETVFTKFADQSLALQASVQESFAKVEGLVSNLVEGMTQNLTGIRATVGDSMGMIGGALSDIEKLLHHSVEAAHTTSKDFADSVKLFQFACGSFQSSSNQLENTYTDGVTKMTDVLGELTQVNANAVALFGQIDSAQSEIVTNIQGSTTSFQQISHKLESYQDTMNRALETNVTSLSSLTQSFAESTKASEGLLNRLQAELPSSMDALQAASQDMAEGLEDLSDTQKEVVSVLRSTADKLQSHDAQLKAMLQSVYSDHQEQMRLLYQNVGKHFEAALEVVADGAVESLSVQIPELSSRSIQAVEGLERSFSDIISQQEKALAKVQELAKAIGFDEARIREELELRREFVERQLVAQLGSFSNSLEGAVQRTVQDSTRQTFEHLRDVSEVIGKKYEDLIDALDTLARAKSSAVTSVEA